MLEILDKYQGQSLNFENAYAVKNIQDDFICNSFKEGISSLIYIQKSKKSSLYQNFLKYYLDIYNHSVIHNPITFKSKQEDMYQNIHFSNMQDIEKMFLEFLLGISRFTLAIQLIPKYIDFLSKKYNFLLPSYDLNGKFTKKCFFLKTKEVSVFGSNMIDNVLSQYEAKNRSYGDYWVDIEEFFAEFKIYQELAGNLVSIQFIPENKRFLSVMQTMHWRGFGGAGSNLEKYPELSSMAVHSIGHHDGYMINSPFKRRMSFFKLPLEGIIHLVQKITSDHLSSKFPEGIINVYDFCSGPRYSAVRGLFDRLSNRKFNLTVSDVDGDSLLALIKDAEEVKSHSNIRIADVRYEDLMLNIELKPADFEKYHLTSVNLGLHQLPLDDIYRVLRYFTLITKPGGLISNLDASERRAGQLIIIPGNIVDREGFVPDVYHVDLLKLVVFEPMSEFVKLAFPLIKYTEYIYENIDKLVGVGPYMINFFTPVKLNKSEFENIMLNWNLKNYDICNSIVRKNIENCSLFLD